MQANQICPVVPNANELGVDPSSLPLDGSVVSARLRYLILWYVFNSEEDMHIEREPPFLARRRLIGHNRYFGDAFDAEFGFVGCQEVCCCRADR